MNIFLFDILEYTYYNVTKLYVQPIKGGLSMILLKRALLAYIIFAFAFVVMGICFIAWPNTSIMTVCYTLGAVLLAWGIVKILNFVKNKNKSKGLAFQFTLIFGLFLAVAGALIIVFPKVILPVIPVIVGVMLCADGIHKIKVGFDAKKMGSTKWGLILISSIATFIFGICLVINPFDGTKAIVLLLGFALLIDGIQNIIVIICTFRLMSQLILPEDMENVEFKEEEIPVDPNTDVPVIEIKEDEIIVEDTKEEN